ncbi:hypothetical protein Cyast_2886 [Cyanobacterium stanieri PCC 7202]|uniref:DUF7305 domain-containing protein n=1 Tax=Cyanobacterium stanieri (strain ATCC 29140 / PCC 7202) TaxID=292563 RepID=K9YPM7_CYASC|nr:hypothetical protein Cyast_2886 [Cyanobacterium stanieri PCC 7202]
MLNNNKFSKKNKNKTNFQFKLLSILQNSSQKGSTLAVGVGLGALMIAGTTLAITTSNQNKTNVTADEQSAQAVAAAEAGVARIQGFLAENPEMAWVDWSELAETTDEEAESIIIGALNNNSQQEVSSSCAPFGLSSNSDSTSENPTPVELKNSVADVAGGVARTSDKNELYSDDNWVSVSSDTQYQLISYTPPENSGELGTLLMRGRRFSDSNTSQAELEVKFPVTKVEIPQDDQVENTSFTGSGSQLWAQNFQASGGGSFTINIDSVADSFGCYTGNSKNPMNWETFITSGIGGNSTVKYNNHDKNVGAFPPLPGNINKEGNQYSKFSETNAVTSNTCITDTLPRSNDQPIANNTYAYNMPLDCAVTFDITGDRNIHVFSDQSINVKNVTIKMGEQTCTGNGKNKSCTTQPNNPGKLIVYGNKGLEMAGNGGLSQNDWKYAQFYIANGNVDVKGTSSTAGFIFAPNSTVQYRGTSSHFGPIWAQTFEVTGGGQGNLIGQPFTENDANYLSVNLNTGTSLGYSYSIDPPSGYRRRGIGSN